MQTIAAIDVGSNGIRMAVASVTAQEQVETIESVRIPVRLGQDVFTGGQIGEASMQAALDAFLRFRTLANQFEVQHIRAIATSAMREAENADVLIDRIYQETGIEVQVINGDEESRLMHLAISRAVDLKDKRAMLIDIGGGSIEVAISYGDKIISAESYALGTVRLLRRLDDADGRHSLRSLLREYTESARRGIKRRIGSHRPDLCVGTGGNFDELGILRKKVLKHDNEHLITTRDLDDLADRLAALTVDERIKKFGLRPDRADVILPAAIVLYLLVKEAGVKEILVPGVGLKDGLLWDMAPLAAGPALPRREQVRLSATRLGQKYHFDGEHGAQVARTARHLFDQSAALHGLDPADRLLLEAGALLHDVGHFINSLDHEKHGAYILKHSSVIGLDDRSRDIVAQLIRYHRKLAPTTQDDDFKALSAKDRQLVLKLLALLRLADAIEVSHTGRVHHVRLKPSRDCWQLKLFGEGRDHAGLVLEKWSLARRKALFEQVFDIPLEVLD